MMRSIRVGSATIAALLPCLNVLRVDIIVGHVMMERQNIVTKLVQEVNTAHLKYLITLKTMEVVFSLWVAVYVMHKDLKYK